MSWRARLKNRESHFQQRDSEMRTQTQNSKGGGVGWGGGVVEAVRERARDELGGQY